MRSGNTQRTKTSIRALQVIILGLAVVVLSRVFYLQVVEYDNYAALGEENSVRQEYVDAARGLIYDRNGVLIVDNEPIYTITVTPANFKEKNIGLLADLLEQPDSLVNAKITEAQRYSWHRSSRLFTDVDFRIFSKIEENLWQLPGIGHLIESKRHYPTEMRAAHVLGYLREANQREYEQNSGLRLGDKIGKSGIEMIYEEQLRGELGVEYIKVNALGQALGNFEDDKIDQSPTQGSDLITTLDADLQLFAEQLMEGKRGAVVAMDPRTGAILSLVSSPGFDLDRLAGRLDQDYWVDINTDSTKPLYNRAIQSQQPPGSTFKPLMGLIGLHLGIITPETEIYNSGAYIRGRAYKDLAEPGDYDLAKAITFSSNTFFFSMMDKIAMQGKLNEWSKLANDFGLGVPPSIDLPNVNRGILPDSSVMNNRFGVRRWGLGDVINLGIGQGYLAASPLQIAQMTSAIANGGYRVQPHLIQSFQKADGSIETYKPDAEKIEWVQPEYLEPVKKGMRGVVLEGSGRWYANHPDIVIAGKTGTAQNPLGKDHGWFTCFAPMDDPQIVVTAFIENAGFASVSAAPIASLVLEKFILGEVTRPYVLNYALNFDPDARDEEDQPAVETENETQSVNEAESGE
ncbi:penicillin-binding protein 2 [Balneola sp. MJW-20]|uniref:penicillin-binding protein 2 n=1 Tax=Gracilimonas aurantiaca TaxID=3234185 RepID=UPI003467863A